MSEKITYSELVDTVSGKVDHSDAETDRYFKALVDVINEGLGRDGEVRIAKWGKFKLKWMDERPGYNPQTGERMTIPGHYRVTFSAYKPLREAVNEPYSHLEPRLLGGSKQMKSKKEDKASADVQADPSTPSSESLKRFPSTSARRESGEPIRRKTAVGHRAEQRPEHNRWILPVMLLLLVLIAASGYWVWTTSNRAKPEIAQQQQKAVSEESTDNSETDRENTKIQSIATSDRKETEARSQPRESSYTVRESDNLWGIADRKLDDPYLWPWIFQKNEDAIPHPDLIYTGLELELPQPEGRPGQYTEADSTRIARAYMQTYRYFNRHKSPRARYYLWAAHQYDKKIMNQVDVPVDQGDLAFVESTQ